MSPAGSVGRFALAAVVLLSAEPLGAQSLSIRLGGVHARYDSLSGSAGAVGLHGEVERALLRASADVTHARFTTGSGASTQASATLTLVRAMPGFALGVANGGSASFLSGGVSAWSGTSQGFVAVIQGPWLASAGVSAGGVRTVANVSHGVFGANARIKRDVGPVSLETSAASTWSGASQFTDALGGIALAEGPLRLTAAVGTRMGDLGGGSTLLQAQGEVMVGPRVFLEAAVGRYPRDLTGFTSGSFANLGLRVALLSGPRAPARRSLEVRAESPGEARVTVEIPNASQVAIAGEWNAWTPAPMTRVAGNRWEIVLPLGRGAYRFAVVVDGDRWTVPAGVPKLPDDFGGEVGVLVIDG